MTENFNWQNIILSVFLCVCVLYIIFYVQRQFRLKKIQSDNKNISFLIILSILVVLFSLLLLSWIWTQPIQYFHYVFVIGLLLTTIVIKFAIDLNYESAVSLTKAKALERFYTSHDDLTGLPNLSFFYDQLEKTLHYSRREDDVFALLIIGLNRFKIINETLGYFLGNSILQEIAHRIRSSLRKTDLIARLGGDEFAVLINPVEAQGHIHTIAKNIAESVQEPLAVEGKPADVGVSIGVAIYPKHASNSVTLIEKARNAMIVAEKQGNSVFVYDETVVDNTNEDIQIVGLLQRAIQEEQLQVFYQPQVRLSDHQTISAEALIRWQHPQYGLLDPGRFIPYAEKAGLIYEINLWLLKKVVELLISWHKKDAQIPVAFNITANGFLNKEFLQQLDNYLNQYAWLSALLKIELTETSSIDNVDDVLLAMSKYKNLGIKFSLDDYGTKHASLEYLHKLPFDELKVDQFFMANATNDNNCQAIIQHGKDIADQLQLICTAEGIENEEILSIAKKYKIDNGQGYYFSPALTEDKFEKYI